MYYLKIYRLLHFLNIESYLLLLLLIIIIFMLMMKNIQFSKASQDIFKKNALLQCNNKRCNKFIDTVYSACLYNYIHVIYLINS